VKAGWDATVGRKNDGHAGGSFDVLAMADPNAGNVRDIIVKTAKQTHL